MRRHRPRPRIMGVQQHIPVKTKLSWVTEFGTRRRSMGFASPLAFALLMTTLQCGIWAHTASANGSGSEPETTADPTSSENGSEGDSDSGTIQEPKTVQYGPKGLDIRSSDGDFHAHIDWRVQLRFTQSTFSDGSIDQSPEVREGNLARSSHRVW